MFSMYGTQVIAMETTQPSLFLEESEAHVHGEECGYLEAMDAEPCSYVGVNACGVAVEAIGEIPCDKNCIDTDENDEKSHWEDCAYSPAVEGKEAMECDHRDNCGYVERVVGHPCVLQGQTEDKTDYEKVVKLFAALPSVESFTELTAEEEKGIIKGQVTNAMDSYFGLRDEEAAKFREEQAGLFISVMALHEFITEDATVEMTVVDAKSKVLTVGTEDADFTSASDAISAANDGETIQLITNIVISQEDVITVPESKKIILDLNQNSITVSEDFHGRPIINRGTLTIIGNGTINSSSSELGGYGCVDNYGDLTIENGTYTGSVYANGASIKNRPGAILIINNGTFDGATCALYNEGKATVNNGIFNTTSCTMTIGSDNKKNWSYAVNSRGELYFNNGSVTGVQGGLAISSGYAEVKDGVFQTVACQHSDNGAYSFYALYIAGEAGEVDAHISGGTYQSKSKVAVLAGNDNTDGDGGINAKATSHISGGTFIGAKGQGALKAGRNTGDPRITGGIFNSDVSTYISPGCKQTDNEDGTYTVSALNSEGAAAEINGIYYATLQEALTAVKEGDTVTVFAGIHTATANEQLRISASDVTLQGMGDTSVIDAKSYSCSGQGGLLVAANNVTLKDLKVISSSEDDNVAAIKFMQQNGPLTSGKIENITVSSEKGHGLNVHGVTNMVVHGLKVENAGKCGAAFSNSALVSVSDFNTANLTALWGDVGLMYKDNEEYAIKTTVTFNGINTFGMGKVYSQRPISAASGQDVINGLTASDGWVKSTYDFGVAYQKGSVIASNGTTDDGFATIQEALCAATSGDTIYIKSGTYKITGINIPTGVTLTSITDVPEDVVLVGTEVANTVILNSNSKIKSVTVTRDNKIDWNTNPVSQGINVAQQTIGATIENCIIKETRNGIYANNTNVTIKNCLIEANRTGVHLANNVSGIISNNTIQNSRTIGLLVGATNNELSDNGYKNLIISGNTFDGSWYAQIEHRAHLSAPISVNSNIFKEPVTLVKADNAGEPEYDNWDDQKKPPVAVSNRLVYKTDGNIIYNASIPPTSNEVSMVEDITAQLPPASSIEAVSPQEKEMLVKQVDTVVEIIQIMSEGEKQKIGMDTIKTLEEVMIAANPNISETMLDVAPSLNTVISGNIEAVGASLTISSDVTTPHKAQVKVEAAAMPSLPSNIANAVALDIKLNILDDMGTPVATNIQPVAPIVITMPIPVGIHVNDLIILHYHGTSETPQRINPTVNLGAKTISFQTSAFSAFVFANRKPTGTGGGSSTTYYTITATAGEGGNISTGKTMSVAEGGSAAFTFTPNKGYRVTDVLINGKSVGAMNSYTFTNVRSNQTISVTFELIHKHENPQTNVSFQDVQRKDWFAEAVYDVVEKSWFAGTSETTFSPYLYTTRGMIVTVLWRMEGEPTTGKINRFEDVANDSWYSDSITWAQIRGIVSGYANVKFGPQDIITREQMVSILYNYAQFKGYESTKISDLTAFKDESNISQYAKAPMSWAVANGLISGKGNGTLDPRGGATRGEVASILYRFDQVLNLVKGTKV